MGVSDKKSTVSRGAILILMIGSFMALLDSSIVNVALPRLMTIFGVSYDYIEWVMTVYLLVSGAVVPVSGYLADRFGARRIYLISLAIFTLGSLLCGLAWSVKSLIFFRALQAIGGGAMMPLAMIIIYRSVPQERIGAIMGILGIAMVSAPAVGPTLGGYLTDHAGWEFIFFINLPIGVLNLFLGLDLLTEAPYTGRLKFDFPGFFFVTTACILILLALSQGESKGWTSYYIVMLLLAALFLVILFVLWELGCPNPMINVRLFTNIPYAVSLLTVSLATLGLFSGVYLIPFYCQTLRGFSAMETGLILMPASIVTALMMPVAGRLFDRVGAVPLGLAGIMLLAFTTYWLHNLTSITSIEWLKGFLAFRSVGLGLCMMPLATAGMNAITPALVAQASAMSNTVRNIAGSISIACITHIMMSRQAFHQVRLTEGVTQTMPAAENFRLMSQALGSSASGQMNNQVLAVALLKKTLYIKSTILAIGDAFIVASILIGLAIPLIIYLTPQRVAKWRDKKPVEYTHIT